MELNERELLTRDQVAEYLACTPRHISRLAARGGIPQPMRIGKMVRWRRSDLDRWVADGCPPVQDDQQ